MSYMEAYILDINKRQSVEEDALAHLLQIWIEAIHEGWEYPPEHEMLQLMSEYRMIKRELDSLSEEVVDILTYGGVFDDLLSNRSILSNVDCEVDFQRGSAKLVLYWL